jgi:hypothetical protein
VTQEEREIAAESHSRAAMMNTAPKMLSFENVFRLGWKIWDIVGDRDVSRRAAMSGASQPAVGRLAGVTRRKAWRRSLGNCASRRHQSIVFAPVWRGGMDGRKEKGKRDRGKN